MRGVAILLASVFATARAGEIVRIDAISLKLDYTQAWAVIDQTAYYSQYEEEFDCHRAIYESQLMQATSAGALVFAWGRAPEFRMHTSLGSENSAELSYF